jgi:hypothetical protein
MPAPSSRRRHAGRRQQLAAARRARRLAVLIALAIVALVVLLLSAFGGGGARTPAAPAPAPATRLLPAGPPRPQVIALVGALRVRNPVAQSRVTAIGYHSAGPDAIAIHPLGTQANQGAIHRLAHKLFGTGDGGLRYFGMSGGEGPATGELDVGAAAGTDVYSPVDGVVLGISPYVIDGKPYGSRIDIRPDDAPSVVVSLTHLRPDPSVAVGSSVASSTAKVGTVIDFSGVEQQSLARYTQDAGNHVAIQAYSAAATLP